MPQEMQQRQWQSALVLAALLALCSAVCAAPYRCEKLTGGAAGEYVIVDAANRLQASRLAEASLGTDRFSCSPPGEAQGDAKPTAPTGAALHPFAGVTLGDYFDAIYNADQAAISALDVKYTARIREQWRTLQRDPALGKIIGLIDLNRPLLIVPAIRAYIDLAPDNRIPC